MKVRLTSPRKKCLIGNSNRYSLEWASEVPLIIASPRPWLKKSRRSMTKKWNYLKRWNKPICSIVISVVEISTNRPEKDMSLSVRPNIRTLWWKINLRLNLSKRNDKKIIKS